MTSLARRVAGRRVLSGEVLPARSGVDDYLSALGAWSYGGGSYSYGTGVSTTLGGSAEKVSGDFRGLVSAAYAGNGVIFACMLTRLHVLSGIRFAYQRLRNGVPSDLWGDASLRPLETPWQGGTTQDLLMRMEVDGSLAGNSYTASTTPFARLGGDNQRELIRLMPDRVTIVLEAIRLNGGIAGHRRVGYLYSENGSDDWRDAAVFPADEVAHYAPQPDPLATYRGMSWLTPVIRELVQDQLMGTHQERFFENGATPNMVIKHPPEVGPEEAREFADLLDLQHKGVDNAYKTLHLGNGADLSVVGVDLRQLEFSVTRGHGETRLAAAAGVPPVIVGLSEGLQAATYSNYGQARRRFADGTCHPLWQNMAGSMGILFPAARDSRLWYDARGVPFLREDEKDAAAILKDKAATLQVLVNSGFTPESAILAVDSGDMRLLVHTGLVSVQLQPPGMDPAAASAPPRADDEKKTPAPEESA